MSNRYKHQTKNGKKQPIHRHIMEEHIGRKLEHNEHVYHVDGDPSNDSLDNLIVITKNLIIKRDGN